MTTRFAALAVLSFCSIFPLSLRAAESARYGVPADLQSFPQATPKEALASVIKAADLKRFDYVLAQLAEPDWVDERIKLSDGGFADLLKETSVKLDNGAIKQLKKLLTDGAFETLDVTTIVRLNGSTDRVVRLKKVKDRWYLRNANKQ